MLSPLLAAALPAGPVLGATEFSGLDWSIVVVYLAISVAIGLLANRVITGLSGYLVAGRSLGTALSIATMTGSELGLITVMYQAQKGFTGGFAALHIGLASGIVALVVGLTGFIVVRLRRSQVMTIPEYYEQRFDRPTRVLGGTLLALGGILNMGLFLRVGSQFVVGVTGLEGTMVALVMVALLLLVLFYTVMGGMVSVVLTDYVQFVVLSIGLVTLVLLALADFGYDGIVEAVTSARGAASFDPSAEFGGSYIAWMGVLGLVNCAIWPTAVTRALSARDETVVKRQYAFSSISFMIRFLLPCFLGIAAFVFVTQAGAQIVYSAGGDAAYSVQLVEDGGYAVRAVEGHQPAGVAATPVEGFAGAPEGAAAVTYHADDFSGFFPADVKPAIKAFAMPEGEVQDSIFGLPLFFHDSLPIGLLGLLTAAMLAAFMSTHDSYLLCWASVIARDIVAPLSPRNASNERQLLVTRIGIVAIGLYVLYWGIVYEPSQDVWEYLGITGAVYFTGAIVVLVGGLYWERASAFGARAALLAGLSAIVGLGPVKAALGITAGPAVIGLVTLGIAALAMVAGSLIFPDPPRADDPAAKPSKEVA